MLIQTLHLLAVIGAGFSVVSALILLVAYVFFLSQMEKSLFSRLACALILLGITGLQLAHLQVSLAGTELLTSRWYVTLLMYLPLAFYLFSVFVLFPHEGKRWTLGLHVVPIPVSFALPVAVVPSIAFSIGAAYTLWLVLRLFRVRLERDRFDIEIFFFAMFALMAIFALVLGLSLPKIETQLFYLVYSLCISVAMISVISLLIVYPKVLEDVVAITGTAYTDSKLTGVDAEKKLDELKGMMQKERLYEDAALSLAGVAGKLRLSTHQLSELINRYAGNNFPGFVKYYRVEAAKTLLREEPKATVLAIGLQTGFKSQSAFYTAFKDATGMSPGAYKRAV